MPNIFGKSLCGAQFQVRIEDYGYTIKPSTTVRVPENGSRDDNLISITTPKPIMLNQTGRDINSTMNITRK